MRVKCPCLDICCYFCSLRNETLILFENISWICYYFSLLFFFPFRILFYWQTGKLKHLKSNNYFRFHFSSDGVNWNSKFTFPLFMFNSLCRTWNDFSIQHLLIIWKQQDSDSLTFYLNHWIINYWNQVEKKQKSKLIIVQNKL